MCQDIEVEENEDTPQEKNARRKARDANKKFPEGTTGNRNGFGHDAIPVQAYTSDTPLEAYRWGLIPDFVMDPADFKANTHNARLEELEDKASYRNYTNNRCVIVCTAFFEYQHRLTQGKRGMKTEKVRYRISMADGTDLQIGGVFNHWKDPKTGQIVKTATMCTVPAVGIMREIHNSALRQPLILNPDEIQAWLSGVDHLSFVERPEIPLSAVEAPKGKKGSKGDQPDAPEQTALF